MKGDNHFPPEEARFQPKSLKREHTSISSSVFFQKYEEFYHAYYGIVLGFLLKKVNRPEDAEDLASKVFLYCFEKWNTYDPAKASQKTWLFMIVRSRWIDFMRSNQAYINLDEISEVVPCEGDAMEEAVRLEAIRSEVAEALESLHEKQRTAIVMRFFGNYDDAEIASVLRTSAINVRVLIHRGLKKMKTMVSFYKRPED